jgi:hypothetical protein
VDYPPPAVRFDTRIATKVRKVLALCSEEAIYMHCGSAGQGKCGGNPAPPAAARFKRAFEIDLARESAIVN